MDNSDKYLSQVIKDYIDDPKNEKNKDKAQKILQSDYMKVIYNIITLKSLVMKNNEGINMLSNAMEETLSSLNYNKYTGYKVFEKFIKDINSKYKVELNIDDFIKKQFKERIERQVDMLKELHKRKGTSIGELSDRYLISKKTVGKELGQLEEGIELLNQRIRISLKREKRKMTYDSTVHPVFLPLNLTEAYALAAVLKEVARGNAYEDVLVEIADWIYSQLSPYGKDVIDRSIRVNGRNLGHKDRNWEFVNERDQISKSMTYMLMHYMKMGKRVTIVINSEEGEIIKNGTIDISHSDKTIKIVSERGTYEEIEICKIKDIF